MWEYRWVITHFPSPSMQISLALTVCPYSAPLQSCQHLHPQQGSTRPSSASCSSNSGVTRSGQEWARLMRERQPSTGLAPSTRSNTGTQGSQEILNMEFVEMSEVMMDASPEPAAGRPSAPSHPSAPSRLTIMALYQISSECT